MTTTPLDPWALDAEGLFALDDYLYFYEETLRAERTDAQVDRIARELTLLAPSRVLDLGCGHGRHALELAARGHTVHGVDMMAPFITRAREDADRAKLPVTFECADLRAWDAPHPFDAAVCLFDAFGLHRDEENLDVLAAMARALTPRGGFCLDLRNRDWMTRHLQPVTVLERGRDLLIDRHAFDARTGRLVDRRVIVRDGRAREVVFSVRLYGLQEIEALLARVGLEVRSAWGDWNGSPVSVNSNRLVLFGVKRS